LKAAQTSSRLGLKTAQDQARAWIASTGGGSATGFGCFGQVNPRAKTGDYPLKRLNNQTLLSKILVSFGHSDVVDSRRTSAVDLHVRRRVRTARIARRLSKQALGQAAGVTLRQILEWEKGADRIATGRPQAIAGSLQVPVTFFFNGVDRRGEEAGRAAIGETLSRPHRDSHGSAVNPQARRHVANLLEAIIAGENKDARSPINV
jgi:transcriptional regulator with XRE-family HTH domain